MFKLWFSLAFHLNCSALNSAAKCFKYMLKVTLCMPSAALSKKKLLIPHRVKEDKGSIMELSSYAAPKKKYEIV